MSTPIKERANILNPNYPRFYEFDSTQCLICSECPANKGTDYWSNVAAINLGVPVHTNWRKENTQINTVYICESPSDKETSHALPSVGRTGQKIYKYENQVPSLPADWLDTLDKNIYRTNIVRCQADAGLQKRVNTTTKNHRVRRAFKDYCHLHLKNELDKILENHRLNGNKIKFVLAIGKGFSDETKKVKDMIGDLASKYSLSSNDFSIEEINHPSS